jgi:hypothetical protein
MTYAARLTPESPCSLVFGEDEWKLLYCAANKTRKEARKPYSIKEAIDYLGRLGCPKRAPSDGHPGVKTVWVGLMKLYILRAGLSGIFRVILWVKFSPTGTAGFNA